MIFTPLETPLETPLAWSPWLKSGRKIPMAGMFQSLLGISGGSAEHHLRIALSFWPASRFLATLEQTFWSGFSDA